MWQQVYDLHGRFQQPISLGPTAEGRYTTLLLATNVVMRPDLPPGLSVWATTIGKLNS